MQRRRLLVALTAALCLVPLVAAAGPSGTVTVGVPGAMPLSGIGPGGAPRGVLLEATVEALRRMGHAVRLVPMPLARLYAAVMQDGPHGIDVAVTVQATPERRGKAHFAPTLVMEYLVLAAPWAADYAPRTISEVRGHVIGGRTGVEYPGLDDLPDLRIKRTNSHQGNARMAIAGRVDGLLLGSITGVWELRESGQMPALTLAPVAFGSIPLTVALNKHRFPAERRAAFDAILRNLQAEPLWEAIVARNGATDLLHDWTVAYE